jgi:tetratricopeptide (TPR) repeat protein
MKLSARLAAAIVAAALAAPGIVEAQPAGRGWRSTEHRVEILALPAGWDVVSSTEQSLRLTKTFEAAGLEIRERITVQVSRDTYGSVEAAVRDLRSEGFFLVDRARLAIDSLGVPFWFMSRPAGPDESAWCALLLRAGRVYVIDLRASPLDPEALSDFGRLIESFRLLADPREVGWNALGAGDGAGAEREFRAILSSQRDDVNARYGLGLAYLAQGRADDAVRELERVAPSLGLAEDVRRALGRAELARGRTSRGVSLLVQVLRDDPAWDPEVRPSILTGIGSLSGARASRQTSNPALTAIPIEFLMRLTGGDELILQSLRADFGREVDQALNTCLSSDCDGGLLTQLLAAVDFEQGMSLGLSARQSGNADDLEAAQARMAEGFKTVTLLTR